MNKEQQRIAIAKACGWKFSEVTGAWHLKGRGYDTTIPDYLNDLNAMHEAEAVLTREQLVDYCNTTLRSTTGEGNVVDYKMIRATADQRAEAFLRTLGLWRGD